MLDIKKKRQRTINIEADISIQKIKNVSRICLLLSSKERYYQYSLILIELQSIEI
jgi:hypothetical protein